MSHEFPEYKGEGVYSTNATPESAKNEKVIEDLEESYKEQIGESSDESFIEQATAHVEKDHLKEMNEIGRLLDERDKEVEENETGVEALKNLGQMPK